MLARSGFDILAVATTEYVSHRLCLFRPTSMTYSSNGKKKSVSHLALDMLTPIYGEALEIARFFHYLPTLPNLA